MEGHRLVLDLADGGEDHRIAIEPAVRRLMRLLGMHALYQRPRTSQPYPAHRIYLYLLRDLQITRPNHVWCTDVTYIPLQRGFLYLVAVMDWASRKVLSWRLSNTLDASFCVEALHTTLARTCWVSAQAAP